MCYIYMLGYDVDFGHMEAVSLIYASKYPEKQVGYIVRNGIIGPNETFQCLALTLIGNMGGREFAESLAPDVQILPMMFLPSFQEASSICYSDNDASSFENRFQGKNLESQAGQICTDNLGLTADGEPVCCLRCCAYPVCDLAMNMRGTMGISRALSAKSDTRGIKVNLCT